ncbi:MAG TPA: CsbD family protein [Thermoanaerobaculia bacterium]|nr:CsbD family protein [Thermoanaerobaculia bacterium]
MNPNKDEIQGQLDKAAGTVKEHVGRATDDPLLESEGADQRAAGEVEHGFGKVRRKVGEAVKDIGDKLGR